MYFLECAQSLFSVFRFRKESTRARETPSVTRVLLEGLRKKEAARTLRFSANKIQANLLCGCFNPNLSLRTLSGSAIATLFPICYLSQLKHLDMNAIVSGKAKTIETLKINNGDELY